MLAHSLRVHEHLGTRLACVVVVVVVLGGRGVGGIATPLLPLLFTLRTFSHRNFKCNQEATWQCGCSL